MLVVNAASLPKVAALAGLIAEAKSRGGKLDYTSAGPGSFGRLSMELLKHQGGFDAQHIAYKGSAPAMNDTLGGVVPVIYADMVTALPQIKAGRLQAVAVGTPQRVKSLPDVPTMAEAGVPGFEAYAWQGFVGPAKLPAPVVQRLNKDLNAALAQPALRAKFEEIGIQPMAMTPREFGDFVRSEQKLWSEVIRSAKIQLD